MHVRARDEDRDPEVIELRSVVFPVEIKPPPGFDPVRPSTWPRENGRLEFVHGRLLYMPPSGRAQSQTAADVIGTLTAWGRSRPDFSIHTNEAGMKLGDDVRAADAAVWRVTDLPDDPDQVPRIPPLLAVEVAGRDDTEATLREKATWYLSHGVPTIWILLPSSREVIVLEEAHDQRLSHGDRLRSPRALPDLTPTVAELFRQTSRRPE